MVSIRDPNFCVRSTLSRGVGMGRGGGGVDNDDDGDDEEEDDDDGGMCAGRGSVRAVTACSLSSQK